MLPSLTHSQTQGFELDLSGPREEAFFQRWGRLARETGMRIQ